jgi:hypothetical protein
MENERNMKRKKVNEKERKYKKGKERIRRKRTKMKERREKKNASAFLIEIKLNRKSRQDRDSSFV